MIMDPGVFAYHGPRSRGLDLLSQVLIRLSRLVEADHPHGQPNFPVAMHIRCGNVFHVCQTKQPNYGVSQRCHHLGGAVFANLRAVFVKRAVADVVDLVFNRPMTAIEGQDILWRCLLLTQAGDAERYLLGSFPTRQQVAMKVRGRPFDTKYLLDVGEVHVVVNFRAGPNFS